LFEILIAADIILVNLNWMHAIMIRENDFAEVSKNLARYISENSYVRLLK